MPPTILLVDDEDATRGVLARRLERAGFTVEQVGGGREALARYRQSPTDLVITDILMPDLGGLELIESLRREFPAVRIVGMSGAATIDVSDVLAEAARLGLKGQLIKPFTSTRLLEVVRSALDQPHEVNAR